MGLSIYELMLLNYVSYQGKHYPIASLNSDNTLRLKCKDVYHQNYSHGSIGCYRISDIKPIPITETWLVSFGFKKKNVPGVGHEFYLECEHGELNWDKNDSLWLLIDDAICVDFTHIKYVHQLQNIYHSLTGKELKTADSLV